MKFFFYLEQNIKLLQRRQKYQRLFIPAESYSIRCHNIVEWRALSVVFRHLGYELAKFDEHRYKQSDFVPGNPLCVGINGVCAFLNEGGRALFSRRYEFEFICQANINNLYHF